MELVKKTLGDYSDEQQQKSHKLISKKIGKTAPLGDVVE